MRYLLSEPGARLSRQVGRRTTLWLLAGVLLGIPRLVTDLHIAPRSAAAGDVIGVCDVAGVVVLCWTAYGLLNRELRRQSAAAVRLEELEAVLRNGRARLHEIDATLGGIVSASQLLHNPRAIGQARRRDLEAMIHSEILRLDRLINHAPACGELQRIDLDEHLGRIVLAHWARGSRVHWTPTGRSVTGVPDALAQVLNTLLNNAASHGSGDTSVTVRDREDGVEILVADSGPGITADVAARLFTWDGRGPDSRGEGIGLTIARDLMVQQGGSLTVRSSDVGAAFAIWLPTPIVDDDKLLLA